MMNYKLIPIFLATILFTLRGTTQTVGTLQNDASSLQGYTFFSPFSGTKAWIVDNCGQLINSWDRGTRPGLSAYFLENGLMLRTYKADLEGPFTSASNAGGIELVDWDNNTVWQYEWNTPTALSHHDAVFMPNGNILLLTWELVYTDELIELGRDPDEIAIEGFMWSEKIVEIEPVGSDDINVIWQWEIKDHYIQDFDDSKQNYGVIADHPELFNINLPDLNSSNSNATRDWNHFNSIDYNESLDQILISVRNSDEIWIIDHSTTTAEAASHEGGLYGRGGDLLYRWGNASAYERGAVNEQKLFGQHGAHWIRDGLTDAGKIMFFNNGNGRPGPDFSTAEILIPPQDANGGYIISGPNPFGPEEPEWVYGDQAGEDYYSPFLSNAQRLVNGNTLINSGSPGRIFEIDPDRNTVWQYEIPLFGDAPATQGGNINNNANFRAYKYPSDYPGFEGVDLTPGATIENGENPLGCEIFVGLEELAQNERPIAVQYFPGENSLRILNPQNEKAELFVIGVDGRFHQKETINALEQTFQLRPDLKGVYFVQILSAKGEGYSEKLVLLGR
ncbi:MAG: aryl-sulfate sulfotransferase [Bacteroidota bacterium]